MFALPVNPFAGGWFLGLRVEGGRVLGRVGMGMEARGFLHSRTDPHLLD